MQLERDAPRRFLLRTGLRGNLATGQELDLPDIGGMDHRAVPPLDPTPHRELLAGERLRVDPSRLEGFAVLAVDEHGEIPVPILVEVKIDARSRLADLRHYAFDQLIAAGETPETLDIIGGKNAVRPGPLQPSALRPRLGLAGEQLADAGMVIGEGIDPREAHADHLALQPDPLIALHHKANMNSNTELTGRPLLLTVKAAAAHLGVSASMVRTLLDRGQLTKIKLTESVKGQCYVRLAETVFVSIAPMIGQVKLPLDLLALGDRAWVIVSGEQRTVARWRLRHMDPEWARALRLQCAEAGVPFFLLQMTGKKRIPDDLLVQEFPSVERIRREDHPTLQVEAVT